MTKPSPTIRLITTALTDVMAIPIDELEKIMQQAHQCDRNQVADPSQRFPISRQAIRMLWHFRCNLNAVTIFTDEGKDSL